MDTDFEGDLTINGISMKDKEDTELARVRNEKIGFVFQFNYLLNEFSGLHNVMLPWLKPGRLSTKKVEHNAYEKLKVLGIEGEAMKKPNQLSGGQKQRVAITRALMNNPLIIVGDEPTGNLDKKNREIVFDIFKDLAEQHKHTLLIVTNDPDFGKGTHRVIEMEDGTITGEHKDFE